MRIKHNKDKLFSTITYYLVLIVALAHLIGFIDLMKWYDFSGIGTEARKIETDYGQIGLILMNLSALILFIVIAVIFNNKDRSRLLSITSMGIISVFFIRGISGYIAVILGQTGSTSEIWSLVFSSIALIIAVFGVLGIREDY